MIQLSLSHIHKQYGDYHASADVSFDIPQGTIFGLLGPNGAGKTTLIRMITRILYPDSGEIQFGGQSLREEHTQQIGYMPEERGLYKSMKVYEHLLYLARLKGLTRADAHSRVEGWLARLDIGSWRDKRIDELSKGMAQKVQFIATVLHSPSLLILDEPFSGLDPINARLIEDEIHRLKQEGKTIIFSTHRMEQVEEICDDIALIHQGRKILDGAVPTLKQQYKENLWHITYTGEVSADFAAQYQLTQHSAGSVMVRIKDSPNALLRYLMDSGVTVTSFQEVLPSLNEIFIKAVAQSPQHLAA
jgi:ABC-2 type transport system ATP-binding protein